MYLDRHDFRGFLIVLSLLSFVAAAVLWIRTLDLEAGTYFIKGYRVWDDQVGIPELKPYIFVAAALGAVFAIAAKVMKKASLRSSSKKEADPDRQRTTRGM
jgi:hypothetical protein